MSRSGYSEECGGWELIRWRGAVASAIKGKRGQEFLRKMLVALDAMPAKRLIAYELEQDGDVCAMGSVGRAQGIDMSNIDPTESDEVANAFGISEAMVREISFVNDEELWGRYSTPEERFVYVRKWVVSQIRENVAA